MPTTEQNQLANMKDHFNTAIQNAANAGVDPKTIAEMEVIREWFTNPEFKAKLSEHNFNATYGKVK